MTISECVFRSTSVLGSQGRALWCSCCQCPAGTALTAPLSCWTCLCPGWLLLQQPLHHQGVRQPVVAGHKNEGECGWAAPQAQSFGGSPRVLNWDTQRDPWKAEVPHVQNSLHLTDGWGAQHLPLSLPTGHHLKHQEWTGLQQPRKILVQWQMQFCAGKRRIKIVRQKIPKESQDIRGKCSEAWWLKRDLSVLLGYESLKLMDNCSGKIMLHSELHA